MIRFFLFTLLSLTPLAATAEPGALTMMGHARIGPETREARFVFSCTANAGSHVTGALGLDLFIPEHEALAPLFDFSPFEGPNARAGARTRIDTLAGTSVITGRFVVSGWTGVDADHPFAFGLSAARRRDTPRMSAVTRVLRPLTQGPARITWTQDNPHPAGVAIVAALDVGAAEAARLKDLLGPCLGLDQPPVRRIGVPG